MNLEKSSSEIINKLKLSLHPEGGWFREIIRGKNFVTRNDGQKRNTITSIYYLLCKSDKSKWHRVNSSDEIWIYLQGAPLNLYFLDNTNKKLKNIRLDSNNPIEIIPSGYWQASRISGEFILISCSFDQGFDFKYFEMLRNRDTSLTSDKAIKELI